MLVSVQGGKVVVCFQTALLAQSFAQQFSSDRTFSIEFSNKPEVLVVAKYRVVSPWLTGKLKVFADQNRQSLVVR